MERRIFIENREGMAYGKCPRRYFDVKRLDELSPSPIKQRSLGMKIPGFILTKLDPKLRSHSSSRCSRRRGNWRRLTFCLARLYTGSKVACPSQRKKANHFPKCLTRTTTRIWIQCNWVADYKTRGSTAYLVVLLIERQHLLHLE